VRLLVALPLAFAGALAESYYQIRDGAGVSRALEPWRLSRASPWTSRTFGRLRTGALLPRTCNFTARLLREWVIGPVIP
jgi:hypothetical protein